MTAGLGARVGSALVVVAGVVAAAGAASAQETRRPEQSGVAQTTPVPSEVSPSQDNRGGPPALPVEAAAAEAGTTQVYDQAFFAQYGVTNVEDMLRRLPGVPAILDAAGTVNQARGLGSGGDQILLDGKRMAGKGQIAQALRRIPASNVQRIELIRGASSEVNVLSEGLIVNIVLKQGASTGAVGSYEINFKFDDMGWMDVDGLISYAGQWRGLSYVFAAQKDLWTPLGTTPTGGAADYTRRFRDERYYYPSGALMELRPQKWKREHYKKIFTADFTYAFDNGDQLRLNIRHQPHPTKEIDETPLVRFSPAGAQSSTATEYHERRTRRDQFELGGELEKKIGPGAFNLIFIHTRLATPFVDFRNRWESFGLVEVGRSELDQHTGEDILRGSYNFPLASNQDLNLGLEGARNTLDQNLEAFFDSNRDGRLEPVVIPTAEASVEELRGEAFAIHTWRASGKLTVESSLSVEVSRIETNYPFIPIKTYKFPKPRVDIRYNFTPRDRLRLKVERTVSQLDFANFVPVYNVVDTRIDAGNPGLAPEKTWIYEASFEKRFANDGGSAEVRGFYRDISDHIDRGAFGFNAASLPFSAPINIDKAKLYGAELRASVRLAPIGLRNAQINGRYLRQWSSVVDPFTGRDRKMKEPYDAELSLGFRHDLTAWRASYGANLLDTSGDQILSDIRNLEFFSRGPRLDAFVEKSLWGTMSIRLEAYNLTRSHEFKRRLLYTVSQANGALVRTETYEEIRDRRFALRLRGKF